MSVESLCLDSWKSVVSEEKCSICSDTLEGPESKHKVSHVSEGFSEDKTIEHVFHKTCIQSWRSSGHDTCPLCNRVIEGDHLWKWNSLANRLTVLNTTPEWANVIIGTIVGAGAGMVAANIIGQKNNLDLDKFIEQGCMLGACLGAGSGLIGMPWEAERLQGVEAAGAAAGTMAGVVAGSYGNVRNRGFSSIP